MIMQIKTEKELIEMVQALKKEIDKLTASNKLNAKRFKLIQAEIDKKPNVEVKETVIKEIEKPIRIETVIKEIEKPTVIKETVIQTDKSVLPTLKKISDRLKTLEDKPEGKTGVIETIIKEIEKPTVIKETVIQTDKSVLPTLKKLSDRLRTLEDKKPEKQIIKEVTIKEVKPVINNVTTGLDDNQVLELINKHVTMAYINKLYKKGN